MTEGAAVASSEPRLIVGVGASAGGLQAFKELLAALPAGGHCAFLLVQHVVADRESVLCGLLAPCTSLAVREAEQGAELAADVVYVAPPGTALAVRDGRIDLTRPSDRREVLRHVDHLFRSIAGDAGPRGVGIVLSGAGGDGSAGLREIKAAGGMTIVQEPSTSGQPGMPQSAIETGVIDLVLPIREMPAALLRFDDLPPPARVEPPRAAGEERSEPLSRLTDGQLLQIREVLADQLRFDLAVYKPATIERRVLRRMALAGVGEADDYVAELRRSRAEQQTLVRDLLISVTDFFRNREAFQALRAQVVEPLVSQVAPGDTLRCWVPGCATGEEAYSIGIEFLEAIAARGDEVGLQIFATDIDQDALRFGRCAIYPPTIASRIAEDRLETYFEPISEERFRVRPRLRGVVSFAVHDLTRDPPLSRMNLVSCRNVLIYLTFETQREVLEMVHYALSPGGYLMLSPSESVGIQSSLFATVSKSHRLYRRSSSSSPVASRRANLSPMPRMRRPPQPRWAETRLAGRLGQSDRARRLVLKVWAPPTIIVSAEGAALFLHGELSPYLRLPQGGLPRLELDALLRPAIAPRVRGVLQDCRQQEAPVRVLASLEGPERTAVRITAAPMAELGDGAVMLSFELLDGGTSKLGGPGEPLEEGGPEVERLERELDATREDLRRTVAEVETFREELHSSTERAMAANEELQSANEELEATSEELRSLNEELTSVNAQLRDKVEQLEQSQDDLRNFFASTEIATVFLDRALSIKRLTPAAQQLLSIDQVDVGRSVSTVARELLQGELEREARAVLDDQVERTAQLQTTDGRWIRRQVLPYRTESHGVRGVVVTFTDVTELRVANEQLRASSRRLELAWEAARGGIYEHRVPVEEAVYHSAQWARLLGYEPADLPQDQAFLSWLAEQIHADDRRRFERSYRGFVAGRTPRQQVEVRLRHRDGHHLWVRAMAKALERDADGRVRHLVGMMLDITDLMQTEQALRESEARFRETADGLPLLVWVHDAAGAQELVNQAFCEFFGVRRDQMTGQSWQQLLHPDDAETYAEHFAASVKQVRPFHAEVRAKRADGAWRWLESWARPRFDGEGRYRGFVGTSVDVTDRIETEQALRRSEERFRMMADNISQLAWMADGDGSIVWYNKRWYDFTGTTADEVSGWGWRRIHHPDHVDRVVRYARRCFAAGEPWEEIFPLRGADGEYRWFLSRAVPFRDDRGVVVRWFGTHTDVTEQRQAEQRLLEADRQKDEFIAMLGHELRNPLAAIRSAAELLRLRAGDEPRLQRTQEVLERQSLHMSELLDGLLDVSRIIRGKVELKREVLDLSTLCREVATDCAEHRPDRHVELRLDLPSDPVWVEGDRVRLAQVVDNLVSNALKYTGDQGLVTVTLDREDDAARLTVCDDGIGIEPELLPFVFDVFRQSRQSLARAGGGLGLGLALVKSLTELHGGEVEAHSEGAARGAEFVVRLPVTTKSAPRPSITPRASGAWRILVIEDNADAAEMLRALLEAGGHEVAVASGGRQGLSLARELRPDVVLCDLGLPDVESGFEVARRLRAMAELPATRLVALSGYGRPEDKARGAEAGFDAYLTKPVDLAALERLLARLAEA